MPGSPFSTIFFDLGNTLIYFDGDWTETAVRARMAIAASMIRHGFKVDETEFGMRFGEAIQQYAAERRNDQLEPTTSAVLRKAIKEFKLGEVPADVQADLLKDYYAISEERWKLPEDTRLTLEKIKQLGYHTALISNAADAANVHRQLKTTELTELLDYVVISAEMGIRKPAREIFQKALDHFQVEPTKAVMVGDLLEADILGARNIGMQSIWLTRWARNPENAAMLNKVTPTRRIPFLRDLPRVLEKWDKKK